MVQLKSNDQVLKVVSMTRYHFVAGLPTAGARHFAGLLAQNPRFSVSSDSAAEQVFGLLDAGREAPDLPLSGLDGDTRAALLRGALDAVHHARPLDAVVIDNNPKWLGHMRRLSTLFPLSRFVVMVRDPARIAAEIAEETGDARSPASLMSKDGLIGAPMGQVQDLLGSAAADRLLLLDYERLLSDPERVLGAVYSFLGERVFAHNFRDLPARTVAPSVKPLARRFSMPSLSGAHHTQTAPQPVWRRSQSSAALMLLSEAG